MDIAEDADQQALGKHAIKPPEPPHTGEKRHSPLKRAVNLYQDGLLADPLPERRLAARSGSEVSHLEIGAGGYAPHAHCDVAALLASSRARSAWLAAIVSGRWVTIGAVTSDVRKPKERDFWPDG